MASYDFFEKAIVLVAKDWFQLLSTDRAATLRLRAAMDWGGKSFVVAPAGDISGAAVELAFIRGASDFNIPHAPVGYIGYLIFYSAGRSGEFEADAFLSGALTLPEAMFDDIWSQISSGRVVPDLAIKVGPTEMGASDATIWDRHAHRHLFITEAEFVFRSQEASAA